jgi:cyclopropane fatty-acyl-phospholipid synthase-like methyltransferase
MKGRESGMPQEDYWASFFDVDRALETLLGGTDHRGNLIEFGCGYGTFTLPAARRITGKVTALDIEPEMVASVCRNHWDRQHLRGCPRFRGARNRAC